METLVLGPPWAPDMYMMHRHTGRQMFIKIK